MTTKRNRPAVDRPNIDTLDALEAQFEKNREPDYRPASMKQSRLDWSHKDPEFYYRWFTESSTAHYSDTPQGALELGYEFERHQSPEESLNGQKVVDNSSATKLYLMKIPQCKKDLFNEELARITDMKDVALNTVGSREYGAVGNKRELGKGTAVAQTVDQSPYPLAR